MYAHAVVLSVYPSAAAAVKHRGPAELHQRIQHRAKHRVGRVEIGEHARTRSGWPFRCLACALRIDRTIKIRVRAIHVVIELRQGTQERRRPAKQPGQADQTRPPPRRQASIGDPHDCIVQGLQPRRVRYLPRLGRGQWVLGRRQCVANLDRGDRYARNGRRQHGCRCKVGDDELRPVTGQDGQPHLHPVFQRNRVIEAAAQQHLGIAIGEMRGRAGCRHRCRFDRGRDTGEDMPDQLKALCRNGDLMALCREPPGHFGHPERVAIAAAKLPGEQDRGHGTARLMPDQRQHDLYRDQRDDQQLHQPGA